MKVRTPSDRKSKEKDDFYVAMEKLYNGYPNHKTYACEGAKSFNFVYRKMQPPRSRMDDETINSPRIDQRATKLKSPEPIIIHYRTKDLSRNFESNESQRLQGKNQQKDIIATLPVSYCKVHELQKTNV